MGWRDGGTAPERDEAAFNARLFGLTRLAARGIEAVGLGYFTCTAPAPTTADAPGECWRRWAPLPLRAAGEHVAQVVIAARSRLAAMKDDDGCCCIPSSPRRHPGAPIAPRRERPGLSSLIRWRCLGRTVWADTVLAALVDVADGEPQRSQTRARWPHPQG